ncbi:MAG: hypothetical protein SGI92_30090 [Bryobacteraceae bacterium]|nr:hypothetical protein [Bryobacteraceae bacterium]
MFLRSAFVRTAIVVCASAAAAFSANTVGLQAGKAALRSAGPLAFGPNGILFIGDSLGASIVAIDTGDTKAAKNAEPIEIKELNLKIAAALGTTADQILINDVIVNPVSKKVYISVSRGRGPEATPVILRTDASGKLTEVSMDNVKFARVSLPNAPDENAKDQRGANRRLESITDLGFVDGKVIVAGLSNEEFSSTLRVIPYPFAAVDKGAGIEIFHGAHGRFETNAPVRTFVNYDIAGKQHILAAYTCTPLVRIPVSELKPGAKVKGTTIAELGNRNRPLDMITYKKDGGQFILMANSSRGVMKLPAEKLESYEGITAQTEKKGVPYETIATLKGVQQLDKLDEGHALLLTDASGTLDLHTIALP